MKKKSGAKILCCTSKKSILTIFDWIEVCSL